MATDGKLVIHILPGVDNQVTADVSAVEFVVGEQRLPARQLDETSWEIDISVLGPGPTAIWAEVTTDDGRVATSDVVLATHLA